MPEDKNVDGPAELSALFASREAFVTYRPLRGEVSFSEFLTPREDTVIYEIPARASLDPASEAEAAMAAVGNRSAAILLPGRRFDASGTRHGQGGGWYDRFLVLVPREWLRVGFCFETQFSIAPLVRREWDQHVDAIVIVGSHDIRLLFPENK